MGMNVESSHISSLPRNVSLNRESKVIISGGSNGGREVFGKIWQNCMLAPPGVGAPLLREILDPPLIM